MNLIITALAATSLVIDAICVNIASNLQMTTINYLVLAVQILVLVYSIILTVGIIFKNIFKLCCYSILVRLFSNTFYVIILAKSISDINIVFYILSYLNIAFSVILTLIKADKREESHEQRIQPYVTQQEKVTVIIVSEPLGEHEDNCSICLDPLKNTEVYKTKCSHIFHTECIKKYVNSNKFQDVNCPNCREQLFTTQIM